jgi:hypothetical protein
VQAGALLLEENRRAHVLAHKIPQNHKNRTDTNQSGCRGYTIKYSFQSRFPFPACLPSSYDLLDVELEYSKCGQPDPFSSCLYPIPDRRHPTSIYQPPTLWQNCSGFCLHTV